MIRRQRVSSVLIAVSLVIPLLISGCSADNASENHSPPPSSSEKQPTEVLTDAGDQNTGFAPSNDQKLAPTDDAMGETPIQKLRIGIFFDRPGVGLMGADGRPSGFDVDVAAYIAWKLGYAPSEIEWVRTDPKNRVPYITENKVDFIVATVAISDKLRESMDFAGPYIVSGEDLLVRADDVTITGLATFPGHTICTMENSNALLRLTETFGDQLNIVTMDSYLKCADATITGVVDAVAAPDITLAGLAAADQYFGKLRLLKSHYHIERLGIAIPKGKQELCEAINSGLDDMMADGSWQRFVNRHTAGTGYRPAEYEYPPVLDTCNG
ncbi:MAG: transporter substrate-binding domain-containing protein [Cellulomonadaceae bacterium]|jgi:glutamate transport system substrate-binding protein|nr:transporter substrate-binding domain-containing protein [Cellulomonadaceae bacterium]